MTIATVDPANNQTVQTFDALTELEVEQRLARAAEAFLRWRRVPLIERARMVRRAGDILNSEKTRYGELMTLEMGKPIGAAVQEAEKCALVCRYYHEHADAFLRPEIVTEGDDQRGEIRYDPIGVVLAVMPWNFPFWQVIRFAAPALVAGNAALLKHASNVPQCALAIEELFLRAGAPAGVFQTLLVESGAVEGLVNDARIAAATLTGSEAAGRAVARTAGGALKKTVLELGGSDPFIVMPTADVATAARVAVQARTINNGQSCIAAKRFIVAESIANDFEKRFVQGMQALTVGDPMNPDTDIGPLATPGILGDLERQVSESVAAGARILTGGRRREGQGNYYEPTVLTDIPSDSPAARDELFGPVASLFRVADIGAAIRLANSTTFGLAASAWTGDAIEAERFAAEIEAGTVFINGMVASDPRFPFGGVKNSGYGRELSALGLREFVNIKTVRINFGSPPPASNTE